MSIIGRIVMVGLSAVCYVCLGFVRRFMGAMVVGSVIVISCVITVCVVGSIGLHVCCGTMTIVE